MTPDFKQKLAKLGFEAGTSIACDTMAFVFFFWSDWRIGVGYVFVWLSELTSNQSLRTAITPAQAKVILDEIKNQFGDKR